jgi:uncharacterized protein YbaR (Trm112 family)
VFVELIEALRCPRGHEETQLVASATRTDARHIMDGILGCPVCGAEFAITDGVALFDAPPALGGHELPDAEVAMRLAAFLELTDARGFALLCGRWGVHAALIQQMTDTPLVLVNHSIAAPAHAAAGAIRAGVVPFAASSARALALDEVSSPEIITSGVRAVKTGGRVLGPSTVAVPADVSELVRDDRVWVGEKTATSTPTPRLVPITRALR